MAVSTVTEIRQFSQQAKMSRVHTNYAHSVYLRSVQTEDDHPLCLSLLARVVASPSSTLHPLSLLRVHPLSLCN